MKVSFSCSCLRWTLFWYAFERLRPGPQILHWSSVLWSRRLFSRRLICICSNLVPTLALSQSSSFLSLRHLHTMTKESHADSYVRFDSITRKIEHKLLKRFWFNVIVVGALKLAKIPFPPNFNTNNTGQTGLGKSTLINTISASHLMDTKGRFNADEPVRQTTEIQTVSHGRSQMGGSFFSPARLSHAPCH